MKRIFLVIVAAFICAGAYDYFVRQSVYLNIQEQVKIEQKDAGNNTISVNPDYAAEKEAIPPIPEPLIIEAEAARQAKEQDLDESDYAAMLAACDSSVDDNCDMLDDIEAGKFLHEECDLGDKASCDNLAEIVNAFNEKLRKKAENKRYEKESCDKGVFIDCYELATEELSAGNKNEAKRLSKIACDGKNNQSCFFLGSIEYEAGNTVEAKRLYKIACDSGLPAACGELIKMEKLSGNMDEAKKILKKACNGSGGVSGCYELALSERVSGNMAEAKKILKNDCGRKNRESCTALSKMEYELGNVSEARQLNVKACEYGEEKVCAILGEEARKDGNLTEALRLYRKACLPGLPQACTIANEIASQLSG